MKKFVFLLLNQLCLLPALMIRPSVRPSRVILRNGKEEASDGVDVFDMDYDVGKLDFLNAAVTEVKQKGFISASSNIVYDCSHGNWLLMQVVYDRNIRLFSTRSISALSTLTVSLFDNSKIIYTGTVEEKQIKKLLKLQNLHSIVVPNDETAVRINGFVTSERCRLKLKKLSKVSKARGKYLMEAKQSSPESTAAPETKIVEKVGIFLQLNEESQASTVAGSIQTITDLCPNLQVIGLWCIASGCYSLFREVKMASGIQKLKAVMPFVGEESFAWSQSLGEERGSILWSFEYE